MRQRHEGRWTSPVEPRTCDRGPLPRRRTENKGFGVPPGACPRPNRDRFDRRCGETTRSTHLQLIKAAFVAVLKTRSIGSTWQQRERERESNAN